MRKITYVPIFIAGLILFSGGISGLYADGNAKARYDEVVRYIKLKQYDFALMELRSILRDFPETEYFQKSVFAIGEYSYDNKAYYDAIKNFTEYINNYPDSKGVIFAKAYLLRIIEDNKNPTWEEKRVFEDIKKDFFSSPLFLLFSEYKEASSYTSAFQHVFKIRYYIDNVEVYRDDELFITIAQ